jgi:putative membrane protein
MSNDQPQVMNDGRRLRRPGGFSFGRSSLAFTWRASIYSGRIICLVALGAALAPPRLALAHPGQPLAPHDLWRAWSSNPTVALGLALLALAYLRGLLALWGQAGYGRGVRPWRAAAFAGGIIALLIALVSPLDALGAALFTGHMAQHMLLTLVAAPLLALGAPLVPLLWALPRPLRRGLPGQGLAAWRILSSLPAAWALHAAALWLWHLPGFYQAALHNQLIHAAEHACFLGTAGLFWWALLQPAGAARYGVRVLALFTFMVQSSFLGALLLAARAPWYGEYAPQSGRWGLTPLEDQQLAGLIMTLPSDAIYLLAALTLFALWLRAIERQSQRREAYGQLGIAARPSMAKSSRPEP